MSTTKAFAFTQELSEIPADSKERHEVFVDMFGQFLFWLRNRTLVASKRLLESDDAREKVGTIRRRYYDGVAALSPEQREAAMLFAEETLNGFCERLVWLLGDEGTDSRLGKRHAYRLRLTMEIVDVETQHVVEEAVINAEQSFLAAIGENGLTDTAA